MGNEHGVRMLHDRVTDVTRRGDRIVSVTDRRWPNEVASWSYQSNPQWREVTTLYAEAPQGSYMNWVWQIPVNPGTVSMGFVLAAEDLKRKRSGNLSTEELYHEQLLKFKRSRFWLTRASKTRQHMRLRFDAAPTGAQRERTGSSSAKRPLCLTR